MTLSYSLAVQPLSAAYAAGELAPENVMRDICAAIAARGDDHVWIHRLPLDEVLAQVASAEQRRASGNAPVPLFGIPFAVKDNIDVAAHPTTAGCPAYSYVAQRTAHVVQKLLDAGAILIGKTNLDQFATGLVGTRSPYGACANAFDPNYISGGSSSGSAIAVASGLVSFALGTDTAGSGRVPAAFNNIVGLKPTPGLLSTDGVVPACRSLDCVSIFALTCDDARLVFDAARGWDARDAYSRRDAGAAAGAAIGRNFRFGLPQPQQLEFFGDAAARDQFERAVGILRGLGGTPVEIDFAPFAETAGLLYQGPWVAGRLAAIKDFFAAHAADMHPVTREIIGGAQKYTAVDAFESAYRLRALQQRCSGVWERIDVLAVPTTGTIYTHEEIAAEPLAHNTRLGYYTNFVNLLDLAAIALPGSFRDDGLPAGVSLIAPSCSDAALAVLGERFHRASGLPLGATGFLQPAARPHAAAEAASVVTLAVVGAHLSGLPLNHQLTDRGARLLGVATTAKSYRLYALPGTQPAKPGLVRVAAADGAAIEVELWSLPVAAFGSFVAGISAPLGIGTITLDDGSEVKGFLCESCAVAGAQDISAYGGWRNYLS